MTVYFADKFKNIHKSLFSAIHASWQLSVVAVRRHRHYDVEHRRYGDAEHCHLPRERGQTQIK